MLFPKLVLLTLIFSFWTVLPDTVKAAETADWGDVVNVEYSLYLDSEHTDPVPNNIDVKFEYIYLSRSTYVPTNVSKYYPEATAELLGKFKEGIVGIEINERKDVNITAEDAYTEDPNHPFYMKDLYFDIKLLTIVYDASEHTIVETTSSTDLSGHKESSLATTTGNISITPSSTFPLLIFAIVLIIFIRRFVENK